MALVLPHYWQIGFPFFLYIIFELSQLFDVVFDTGGGQIDFLKPVLG